MLTVLRRILRIEPAVSLGAWFAQTMYSLVTNWPLIWAALGGIAVTWSAVISDYPFGPLGIAGTGIGAALIIGLSVARIRLWAAKRSVEQSTERYIKARVATSNVNPLDVAFTQQKIDIRDLIRPLSQEVRNKTFVRCQIVGPINIVLVGSTNIANPKGTACEAVYCDNDVYISNAIQIIDCDFRDCEFFNVTFMVLPAHYERFTDNITTSWITSNPDNYTYLKSDGTMSVKEQLN